MMGWQGRGTSLPAGFASLRAEVNTLQCSADVRLPGAGPVAQTLCGESALQLLCRALRLAPACYRRFELAAAQPAADNKQLRVLGDMTLTRGHGSADHRSLADAAFDSVAALGAAMAESAADEGLSVQLSPDEQSIVVRRNCN